MPSIHKAIEDEPIKMLLIGDPGSGKTGAIAGLANAGFKVRVVDLDNNIGPLGTYVDPSADLSVFSIADTRDASKGKAKLNSDGPRLSKQRVRAWDWTVQVMDGWRLILDPDERCWRPIKSGEEPTEDLGSPMQWGSDTVLVFDSLSFLANAGMRKVLIEGPGNNQPVSGLNAPPRQADYGAAQALVRNFVDTIASSVLRCHVVCITHLQEYYEGTGDNAVLKGRVPSLGNTGKAHLNEIPRYFDTILWTTRKSGKSAERYINTEGDYYVSCKNPLGDKVPSQLPLSTGLADYFEARGFTPGSMAPPVGAETPSEERAGTATVPTPVVSSLKPKPFSSKG